LKYVVEGNILMIVPSDYPTERLTVGLVSEREISRVSPDLLKKLETITLPEIDFRQANHQRRGPVPPEGGL